MEGFTLLFLTVKHCVQNVIMKRLTRIDMGYKNPNRENTDFISLRLPKKYTAKVDQLAKDNDTNRSYEFRQAIRRGLSQFF